MNSASPQQKLMTRAMCAMTRVIDIKLFQLNVFSLPLNRTTGLSFTKLLMFMTLKKKKKKKKQQLGYLCMYTE